MKEIYELNNFQVLTNEILKPLNKTHRIKYTCFDASTNYIVCGATSGSIYLFQRKPCKFLQLIPNTFGPINNVSISPQEHYVAFSSQKGTILVHVIDLTAIQPQVISSYYREMTITELIWKQNECQLFFGELKGNVFVVNLNNFLRRSLSNISIHPILFLESPVVQICDFDQLLLVSNYTKCILCNTETEEFKQIGNQPRDGKFGACFLLSTTPNELPKYARICCARPGSRLWECTLDGHVLQTHKFKMALKTIPSTKVRHKKDASAQITQSPTANIPEKSNNTFDHLNHLQPISNRFVFAYTDSCFYVFDLKLSTVILWNDEFEKIDYIKVINNNSIVIFTKDFKVFMFEIQQLNEVFIDHLNREQFVESAEIILKNVEYFKQKLVDKNFLLNYSILKSQLEYVTESVELLTKLKSTFDELVKARCKQIQDGEDKQINEFSNGKKLDSGVYLVDNSYATIVKHNKSFQNHHNDDNIDFIDDQNDCEEIVADHKVRHKTNSIQVQIEALSKIENKPLPEDEKIARNLFFIYKSLKMSNCDLTDRYAHIFDQYDLPGIRNLLSSLEKLILENDKRITDLEAKQHCIQMYLNYLNPEAIWDMNDETLDYILDSFVVLNTQSDKQNVNRIKRCSNCEFPLIIEMYALKQEKFGKNLIKYFWSKNQLEKCYNIIRKIPFLLNLLVEIMINEKLNGNRTIFDNNFESASNKNICDNLFACANKTQFEKFLQMKTFQTTVFWDKYLEKLTKLRHDGQINCILCNQSNFIDWNRVLGVTKSFYSYEYVFNQCADHLKGLNSLQLCKKYAKLIPCDALGKNFYLKCLLNA